MAYINTENEAYQQLLSWQKWLVHLSQNAFTRFIYQIILLADLYGLSIIVLAQKSLKTSIVHLNFMSLILPLCLIYLFIMQFGWLFSWYAMVNKKENRTIYFKLIYTWLILAIIAIAIGITLNIYLADFNSRLLYTSLCFFIGWLNYEMTVLMLHLTTKNKISTLTQVDGEFSKYSFKYSGSYITINNDINNLVNNTIKKQLIFSIIAIVTSFICITLSLHNLHIAVIIVLGCIAFLWSYYDLDTTKGSILPMFAKHESEFTEEALKDVRFNPAFVGKRKDSFCFNKDANSAYTDWSDVKYRNRNRNQKDAFAEKISHQLHLIFNSGSAHYTYLTVLEIISICYVIKIIYNFKDAILKFSNFITIPMNIIAKINFQTLGCGLIALIAIIGLCYLEYVYLCKQR